MEFSHKTFYYIEASTARASMLLCARATILARKIIWRALDLHPLIRICAIFEFGISTSKQLNGARALCTFLVFNLWKHIILNKNLKIMNNHHVKYKRARQCFKIEIRNVLHLWLRLGVRKNKKEYNITCTFCGHTFHIWILAKFNSKTVARVHTIHWDLVIAKTPYP